MKRHDRNLDALMLAAFKANPQLCEGWHFKGLFVLKGENLLVVADNEPAPPPDDVYGARDQWALGIEARLRNIFALDTRVTWQRRQLSQPLASRDC